MYYTNGQNDEVRERERGGYMYWVLWVVFIQSYYSSKDVVISVWL